MGNIMVRMGVVIGILVAVQLGFLYVGHLAHPAVVEPQRPLEELSHGGQHAGDGNLGRKDAKLDERTFNESEVDVAVSRIYTKEGHNLKFLLAEYHSRRSGLYHNPMNCYHTQGFTLIGEWRCGSR